ncbi:MAG: biotin--[acetyl-CoA-carboxylase] ligase [Bacteroidetes bacterium]|nr:biotin--[acetyl-CoA-carboxylase] ligase [Bacteroidota bacterium]
MKYDIYRFGKIDSTNSYLLGLGDEGFPEGTVAVADEQTDGRGRFGRKWESESLSNLLFSILLRPGFLNRDEVFILTFSAAVAVAEALENVAGVSPELKWPNDVLLDGKKVCGILLESSFEASRLNYLVLGAGLNVNQSSFPAEIRDKATSLSIITGRKFDREEVLSTILARFGSVYETLKARDFYSVMKRWRNRSKMFGRKIELRLADRVIEGILEEVTDDGAILVGTSSGLQKFTAGEITISKIVTSGTGEKD